MLLDSNILIYLAEGLVPHFEEMIARPDLGIARVTRIETLGYHRLLSAQREYLERAMDGLREFPLDDQVCHRAISLRQERKMGLQMRSSPRQHWSMVCLW